MHTMGLERLNPQWSLIMGCSQAIPCDRLFIELKVSNPFLTTAQLSQIKNLNPIMTYHLIKN